MAKKKNSIVKSFFIWLSVFVSIWLALSRIAYNAPAAWRSGDV
jgi:hypothetical protein